MPFNLIDIDGVEFEDLLEPDDCKKLVSIINARSEPCLIERAPGLKTLGCASYIDITNANASKYWPNGFGGGTLSKYLCMAQFYNPMLISLFSGLYRYICDFFSKRFQVNCDLHYSAAVPGFHLYDNLPQFSSQHSHIPHFDGQYEDLAPLFSNYLNVEDFIGKTISFTIPISLPSSQSGIRFWDLHYKDVIKADKSDTINKLLGLKPRVIHYEIGKMVFHSGHLLHQIKSWKANSGDMPRITLQGHGLLYDNCLYIYW